MLTIRSEQVTDVQKVRFGTDFGQVIPSTSSTYRITARYRCSVSAVRLRCQVKSGYVSSAFCGNGDECVVLIIPWS